MSADRFSFQRIWRILRVQPLDSFLAGTLLRKATCQTPTVLVAKMRSLGGQQQGTVTLLAQLELSASLRSATQNERIPIHHDESLYRSPAVGVGICFHATGTTKLCAAALGAPNVGR